MKYLKRFEEIDQILGYDINGIPIERHEYVLMPDPEPGDYWEYGDFEARADCIRGEYICVEDGDGDYFDIYANRVVNVDAEWYEDEGYKQRGLSYEDAKKMKEDQEKYNI